MLLLPAFTQLIGFGSDGSTENRLLARVPTWQGLSRIRDFVKQTDAYVKDNFGLRRTLVRFNSLLRYHLGSSSSPLVAIGRDGWLFYTGGPGEHILEQHTGQSVFTPQQLAYWVETMKKNRDWLASRGISFFILVAPDKSTIYPEMLPAYPTPPGVATRLDQLMSYADAHDLNIIDPRSAMFAEKQSHPEQRLYRKGDSHWTQRGAFIAYRRLMERVTRDFPSVRPVTLDDYWVSTAPVAADLAMLLGLSSDLTYTGEILTARKSHQLGMETRNPVPGKGWGWPIRFVQTDLPNRPRILTFGDSFTDYVLGPTFLYETFRDPVHTHHNGGALNFKLVEETKPKIVLFQLAERYLILPPGLAHLQ